MADYHFHGKIVTRSKGRSVTAAAAYRAGVLIADRRSGKVWDYSWRGGVLYAEILTPDNASPWMHDRAKLWNVVELGERRKDSQLAREFEIGLPHELTHEKRIEMLREFVSDEFVSRGMVADMAIHAPSGRGDYRNHHAHVLLTMRELTDDGFGLKERGWNNEELLEHWREAWANHANRVLEREGIDARVDHRSLEEQGIEREPTKHRGRATDRIEESGTPTERGDDNRQRIADNDNLERKRAELAEVKRQIALLERLKTIADHASRVWEKSKERENAIKNLEPDAWQEYPDDAPMLVAGTGRAVREADDMLGDFERLAKPTKEPERISEDTRQRSQEFVIQEAGARFALVIAQHYDVRDPDRSMAQAQLAEDAIFKRDSELRDRQIARAATPEERRGFELCKRIEGNDYRALVGERLAQQSEEITGRKNSEEAVKQRARVAGYQAEAKNARQQLRELILPREQQQTPATAVERPLPVPATTKHRDEPNLYAKLITQQNELMRKKTDPENEQERLQQQERERKNQRDRERER